MQAAVKYMHLLQLIVLSVIPRSLNPVFSFCSSVPGAAEVLSCKLITLLYISMLYVLLSNSTFYYPHNFFVCGVMYIRRIGKQLHQLVNTLQISYSSYSYLQQLQLSTVANYIAISHQAWYVQRGLTYRTIERLIANDTHLSREQKE